ncbi:hypothetical protein [Qipengyuania mesophila]|uniref:hypothetical protein n=1 Tax=Qipengyuania mesophila TaxID=2867246 RepID=UPI00351705D1
MNRSTAVIVAAAVLLALFAGLAIYEFAAFGWHFAREEVPGTSAWHWLRTLLIALASLGLVTSLSRMPIVERSSAQVGGRATLLAYGIALLAVGATLVLVADPRLYQRMSAEDSAIEWSTALSLFLACGFMVLRQRQLMREPIGTPWRWLHVLLGLGFIALFFLMGMEEVSWFQRQIGFATPASVAAENWQGEFNLHNLQTDITELALYSATGVFLMLLPLVRERLATWPLVVPLLPLLPDRTVAALSAPMLVFTYSHWDLPPVQAAFWTGLFACLLFARSSGARGERLLWSLLVALVAIGQIIHLALGHTMLAIYDSSEYRELFIAIGLAAYAFRQWRTGGRLTQT